MNKASTASFRAGRPGQLAQFLAADLADSALPAAFLQDGVVNASPVPDCLRYAAGVLGAALGCAPDAGLKALLEQAGQEPNARTIATALEKRSAGIHAPYRLVVETGHAAVWFMIHTRPAFGGGTDLYDPASAIAIIEPLDPDQAPDQPAQQPKASGRNLAVLREKHRVLYDILPIGLTITDEDGIIIEVNSVSEKVLAHPAEALIGKSVYDDSWQMIRPDGSPLPPDEYACVRALRTGETLLGQEVGIIRENGEVIWLSIYVAPIDLEGYGIAIIYVDVTKSRIIENNLRKREHRYRMAVEAGHIGVWEWELNTGNMYLDPNLKHMLGYEDWEIESNIDDWSQHVHAADQNALQESIQQHLSGQTPYFDFEHRMLHKNGSQVWVLARGVASFDADGNPVSMTGTDLDITDRKLAEEALEVERKRLFSLLDRLPAFVCLIATDRTLRFKNRYFVEQFSEDAGPPCTTACAASCPTFEVFDTRSLAVWEWTSERTGQVFQIYDYPFEDVDGSPLVLELGIDVTVSRRAQDALQASEQRYRSITDNLAMGIAMVDENYRVVAANPKLREWYSHVDFDSPPPCKVLFPSCAEDTHCKSPCTRVLAERMETEILEDMTLAGGTRTMRFNFYPVRRNDGSIRSLIVMIEDVTDRLRDQARLQRAQKLEAMGTLAGGIAHEINQPLNALRLYVSGLDMVIDQQEIISRELVKERLGLIMNECRKISDIIVHMRSLVRQETRGLGSVDLNHALESALSLVTAQLRSHDITLRLNLQSDLPKVHANPVQVEQVVINLVVNAMNALESVTPAASKRPVKPASSDMELPEKFVYIRTESESDHVILSVHDNGPGFKGMEDRLFDPFFTTKDPGKGMGLGLSIVHTMVRSWDAEISAGQSPWGGATFTVRMRPAE